MPAIRVLVQQRTIRGGFRVKTRDSEAFKAWFGCCPTPVTVYAVQGVEACLCDKTSTSRWGCLWPCAWHLHFNAAVLGRNFRKGALNTRPVLLGILIAWKVFLAQLMASAILVSLFSSACTTSSRTSRGYATAALLQRQKIVQHEV